MSPKAQAGVVAPAVKETGRSRFPSTAFWTALRREVTRFWSIKRQTLGTPILETYLYITIFGGALGSRIHELEGFRYIVFVVPGLIMMSMAMNSFSNNAS